MLGSALKESLPRSSSSQQQQQQPAAEAVASSSSSRQKQLEVKTEVMFWHFHKSPHAWLLI